MIGRAAQALVVGGMGGALAAVSWSVVGLTFAAAVVGSLNGLIAGWLGVYGLGRVRGWVALILDSSWGLIGTATGLVLFTVNLLQPRSGYEAELSHRQDRLVFSAGFRPRKGFAITLGNVVSNAGGSAGLQGDSPEVVRRRRFVTAHEELHIWQNRWFGPLYQVFYLTWMATGAIVGSVAWPVVKGRWWNVVETVAYYDNPFEYWAYRNDGHWPPRGLHPRLGWHRPLRRPRHRKGLPLDPRSDRAARPSKGDHRQDDRSEEHD